MSSRNNRPSEPTDWAQFLGGVAMLGLVALIGWAIYACACYRIDLYHRKYPGTSTLDFWMDHGR